jgi:dUTP pyrophosphatase
MNDPILTVATLNTVNQMVSIDMSYLGQKLREFFSGVKGVSDSQIMLSEHDDSITQLNSAFYNIYREVIDLPYLEVKRLTPTAKLPSYGSDRAIGLDLYADCPPMTIGPNERALISTGIAVAIPHRFYGRIAPRSGLALKAGINVLGGVIDPDYRGEVMVLLHNTNAMRGFEVGNGMRVAQLIMERAEVLDVQEVSELPASDRGEDGFGSTGSF